MKAHSSEFKNNIKLFGKELDSIITYTANNEVVTLSSEDLNSVTPSFGGNVLKSVMKQLDIDSNVAIPKNTIIDFKFGLKIGDSYEYLDYGNYKVISCEKKEDTNSYQILCYDMMINSMKNYSSFVSEYPISIRNYLNSLCETIGINFADKNNTFTNYNREIQKELYLDDEGNSLNYTFRDVLDELAQVTASTICINNNDELEIRYINETNDIIDEEYLKDVNVNFGEKFGPINSVVLSRSAESDNVYLQNEESIQNNGLCKIKIHDNQIMNWNDRSDYLPEILEKLSGLQYYINDFSSPGIMYYDLCDKYTIQIDGTNFPCIMLNDEQNITQGLVENIYTNMPNETQTDYSKSDVTDRKINETWLIVNKQKGEIQALVSKQEKIEKEITVTKQENGNPIEIEDAGEYPLAKNIVYGKSLKADNKIYVVEGVEETSEENENTQKLLSLYTHGRNIFDKDNYTSIFGHINSSGVLSSNKGNYTLVIPIKPNTTYAIQKMISTRFIVGISSEYPNLTTYNEAYNCWDFAPQIQLENVVTVSNKDSLKYTTDSNAKYLYLEFWVNNETIAKDEVLDSIMISKGAELYDYDSYKKNEVSYNLQDNFLGQVGEVKDELDFNTGILEKNIGKVIIDGTENYIFEVDTTSFTYPRYTIYQIPSDYENAINPINAISNYAEFTPDYTNYSVYNETFLARYVNGQEFRIDIMSSSLDITTVSEFKAKLQEKPLEIYYVLNKPYTVQLNKQDPLVLLEGYNYISTSDELLPSLEIEYLTDSELNANLATKSELTILDNEMQAVVSSNTELNAKVNDSVVQLNNTMRDLDDTLGHYLTEDSDTVVNIKKSVEQSQTDSQYAITVVREIEENGVSKVKTSMGYTFDDNGFEIDREGAETGYIANEKGMKVIDKTGVENSNLLYAGIDDNPDSITYKQSVVQTKNIKVEQFFQFDEIMRMEKFEHVSGVGIGHFF